MINTRKKTKITKWLLNSLFFVLCLVTTVLIFDPHLVHAAMVYEVLKDTSSGEGQKIYEIWKGFLSIVNSLMIVVLIVVAFAEILRYNINTYGFKKLLPTLIFAVIAANFSFLFCRIIIDVANVSLTFISCISASCSSTSSTPLISIATPPKYGWDIKANFWSNLSGTTATNILLFIETIILLCLAFLFIVRNWVIYFLVMVSPIAFLAMVMPQTKKYFNQWWDNLTKWTFMPLISYVFIGLAVKFESALGTSNIMKIVFPSVCMVAAIGVPFKLGGSVMDNFYKYTGAKWGVGQAKDWSKRGANAYADYAAKNGGKLNAVGAFRRSQLFTGELKNHMDKAAKNNREAATANILNSNGLRGQLMKNWNRQEAHYGGDIELAKSKDLGEWYKTEAGKKATKGRGEFLAEKAKAEAEVKEGQQKGILSFRREDEARGADSIVAATLRANKQSDLSENQVAIFDKLMLTNFNNGEGQFKSDEDKSWINEYFAILTRNKELEEMTNKSESQRIEAILQDQIALNNMSNEIRNVNQKLEQMAGRLGTTVNDMLRGFEQKRMSGTALTDDEKTALDGVERRDLVMQQAFELYNSRKNKGETHLDDMIDVKAGTLKGFSGAFDLSYGLEAEQAQRVGNMMATRAAKMINVEVKSDADKLEDEMTRAEIADQLKNGALWPDGNPMFTSAQVENFKDGNQYMNDPATNRRIEARIIALSRAARQSNNPESYAAREGLVGMLNQESMLAAANSFNEQLRRFDPNAAKTPGILINIAAGDIDKQLIERIGKGGKHSSFAYTAVSSQKNVGLSKNPDQYFA